MTSTSPGQAVSMTEIEAKYAVSDPETFDRLKTKDRIGRFSVRNGRDHVFHDRFYDTPDGRLLKAGCYFRVRFEDGKSGLGRTLKINGSVSGSVHRREEMIENDDADASPAAIRDPAFAARLSEIGGGCPAEDFEIILALRQERRFCDITDGDRLIAILSYDAVFPEDGQAGEMFMETEIELAGGTEDDLAEIGRSLLAGSPGLTPVARSKFEKARLLFGGADDQ